MGFLPFSSESCCFSRLPSFPGTTGALFPLLHAIGQELVSDGQKDWKREGQGATDPLTCTYLGEAGLPASTEGHTAPSWAQTRWLCLSDPWNSGEELNCIHSRRRWEGKSTAVSEQLVTQQQPWQTERAGPTYGSTPVSPIHQLEAPQSRARPWGTGAARQVSRGSLVESAAIGLLWTPMTKGKAPQWEAGVWA